MFDYAPALGYSSSMGNDLLFELRERIVSPEFVGGAVLNEKVLAEEFNVSRTPVREALIRLKEEGLVSSAPGRGFYVKDIGIREFRELSEIRWSLSSLVSKLAAERITDEELEDLRLLYEDIEEDEPLESLRSHDMQFHAVVDGATHNSVLIKQKKLLVYQFARARYSLGPAIANSYFVNLKGDVGAFLEGALARDVEACTVALQNHLRRFIDQVFSTEW
jgi:DNA-binding GntR family transcriptional regulator